MTAHLPVSSLYPTITLSVLSAVTCTVGALGAAHNTFASGIMATSHQVYSGALGTGYEISTAPVGCVSKSREDNENTEDDTHLQCHPPLCAAIR